MGSQALRYEVELPPDQVAVILHRTAEALLGGSLRLGDDALAPVELRALRLSLERRGAALWLKVKGCPAAIADDAAPPRRYRALKRELDGYWRALRRAVRRDEQPEPGVVARFVALGRAMTDHPDKGAAFFPAWREALQTLEHAAAGGDRQALAASIAALDELRRAAHHRSR